MVTALSSHYTTVGNTNKAGQGACIAFMFLFVTFYGFGVDVSSYVYCSEIFPTHVRAKGVGWSVSGLFLVTTVYTTAAGPAFNNIGWKYYLVFVLVTSCMLPYFAWKFPETKGLSLEEVGGLFGDEVALDVSNLTEEQQNALDAEIRQRDRQNVFEKGSAADNTTGSGSPAKISHSGSKHIEKAA